MMCQIDDGVSGGRIDYNACPRAGRKQHAQDAREDAKTT